MGHESTEMTLRYIGVNLSDQTKAFEAVRNLRSQSQKTAKIVPSLAEPVAISGPNRIWADSQDWLIEQGTFSR